MKTLIAAFVVMTIMAVVSTGIYVHNVETTEVDLQIWSVVCTEDDGSGQVYEYVHEVKQSTAFEEEFCRCVTKEVN